MRISAYVVIELYFTKKSNRTSVTLFMAFFHSSGLRKKNFMADTKMLSYFFRRHFVSIQK
jgi:hypothetical protein